MRTEKKEPNCTCATKGADRINYPDDIQVPMANQLLINKILNSVISRSAARFATADISIFYIMTPLKRPEFAKINIRDIPTKIIQEYNLCKKATPDDWVYIEVIRGMYGLPQAESLGHDLLEDRLNKEQYYQSKIVPGLWKHMDKPTMLTLVVNDFRMKYIKRELLDHIINTLWKYDNVSLDLKGKEYVKIPLDCDYENGQVHLSMQPYLAKAPRQFYVQKPEKWQDSSYPHIPLKYGENAQYADYDKSK